MYLIAIFLELIAKMEFFVIQKKFRIFKWYVFYIFSPKSPPNSPNTELSTEDELKGVYINYNGTKV